MSEIKDADLSGMCKPQAGASWWSGTGGPEDDLKDIIDALKENLVASQAREQELRAALKKYGMHIDIGCCDVDDPRTCVCGLAAILAADPVERGRELVKAREG